MRMPNAAETPTQFEWVFGCLPGILGVVTWNVFVSVHAIDDAFSVLPYENVGCPRFSW